MLTCLIFVFLTLILVRYDILQEVDEERSERYRFRLLEDTTTPVPIYTYRSVQGYSTVRLCKPYVIKLGLDVLVINIEMYASFSRQTLTFLKHLCYEKTAFINISFFPLKVKIFWKLMLFSSYFWPD